MKATLHRYILHEIWPPLFASLLIFVLIVLAARMLNIAEWVVNHGVRPSQVAGMIFYLLPGMILFAMPAAALMAVFIAFLRLSSDNEVMAMKSSGISLYQMLPPVLWVSIAAFLSAICISVFIVPWGNRSFKDLVFRIAKSKADLGIKERIFSEPFDKVTFYVNSFSPTDKVMKDIFLVDRREPSATTTIVAKTGTILTDPKGKVIVIHLMDGTAFTMEKKSNAARTVHFSSYDVTIGLDDLMPADSLRARSPKEMNVPELIRQIRAAGSTETIHYEMVIELMERFSIPFAVFLMGIVGAPLGAQIRSSGRSLGIGISLAVFVLYYLLLAGVRSMGETGTFSPYIGMWLPAVVLMISGAVLLRKVQNEHALLPWERWFR